MKIHSLLLLLTAAQFLLSCKKKDDPEPSDSHSGVKLISETNGWTVASSFDTVFTRTDYDRIATADFQIANNTVYQKISIELRQQFDILITDLYTKTNLQSGSSQGHTPKPYLQKGSYFYLENSSAEYGLNSAEPYDLYKNGAPWTQADRRIMPYYNGAVAISSHTLSSETGLMATANPYLTVSVLDVKNRTHTYYSTPSGGFNTIGNGRGAILIDEAYTLSHPGHHRVLHASLDFVPGSGNVYQLKVADMCDSIRQTTSNSYVQQAKSCTDFDTLFSRNLNGSLGALTYLSDAHVYACQDEEDAYYWVREDEGYNRSLLFRYNKAEKKLYKLTEFASSSYLTSPGVVVSAFTRIFKIPGRKELLLLGSNGLCHAFNWETKALRNLSAEPGTDAKAAVAQVYKGKIYNLVYRADLYVEDATYRTNVIVRPLD